MEATERKTCMVCGEPKDEGITIVTEFICTSCESEMVHTSAEDERYPFFVKQLKQLWVRFHI
ncbi:sigma factor G inhibitor Gin [Cohnella sp. LGH]|uniref:Inhibitor of sigma-G Gin protein n=2 Tax=Cohnella TaxID=329857 RepID=A0A3D9IS48_9BACL|nr:MULTISPECIES: sigma factor G inhibitor Gin [Cohnella]QTH42937.1 sigma factor G inhibitor Gin [Cohnella sp. LGH]RED64584.1 inhibitor of sigma-G Gin protein [Cohnella phaseoli]